MSLYKRLQVKSPETDSHIPGEDRSFGSGLYIDLVPRTAWYSNVRAMTTPHDWQQLSHMARSRVDYTCEACGYQGESREMDCHERWSFQNGVQKLMRLVCLCKACHEVTHFGLARVKGREQQAYEHLRSVTGMDSDTALDHIEDAFHTYGERSQREWTIDVSILEGIVPMIVTPS